MPLMVLNTVMEQCRKLFFFSQACGARIVVLNVINIDNESATSAHAVSTSTRGRTKEYIENIKKMAADNDIECKVIIEESYQPDKTIVDLAYQNNADLIIMGRHGRKRLLKLLVGSMTSKVIGRGFPRVLIVPKDFSITGKRILVAHDGSELSEMATEEAMSMSVTCSTLEEVYVLSVAKKDDGPDHAKQLAESVCDKFKDKGLGAKCFPLAAVGRPSEIIVNKATENNVDLILVGGHGKGLGKLLMGHVTEKVIGKAHCAVFVVGKKK
ncbi:MAG TPA: universal stress protein [Desulfocapsa sulfexigens]|nr:universal stress protein [Desulfocapsa sulfexigens]